MTKNEKKIICPSCKNVLPQDSEFCQYCGSKIETPSVISVNDKSEAKEAPLIEEVAVPSVENEIAAKILASGIVEGQKAIEANRERQPHNELDADFGLVPQKPVYTAGIDEQEKYLKSLRTINGDPIKWNRRGSISVNNINGIVDVYDTFLPSGEEYKTIYVNMYGAYTSTFAPKGFSYLNQSVVSTSAAPQKVKSKKSSKVKTTLLITGIVAMVAVFGVIFAIPEINYQKACSLLDDGLYDSAISMFEELEGYKKSEDKINEAKYGYVLEHRNNSDTTTFAYLKTLKSHDYKDSKNIYKELYDWKIEVVAINSSEDDKKNNKTTIKRDTPIYFHIDLSGGEPNESVRITVKSTLPNGNTKEYTFDQKWNKRSAGWYGWTEGLSSTGTLRCHFYDEDGNMIGAGSVKITE